MRTSNDISWRRTPEIESSSTCRSVGKSEVDYNPEGCLAAFFSDRFMYVVESMPLSVEDGLADASPKAIRTTMA